MGLWWEFDIPYFQLPHGGVVHLVICPSKAIKSPTIAIGDLATKLIHKTPQGGEKIFCQILHYIPMYAQGGSGEIH